ncbi:MAG: hypothetical protein BIFFINMI_02753 [Phycisphaerae bacterium]|nr:hypothetical protein [Phycisphaerae bacterium]
MFRRILLAAAVVLATTVLLLAGKPGEKAEGPAFKSNGYSLVWGRLKTSGDVDLGDDTRSRYSLQLDGSLEVPSDADVAAVYKRLRVNKITDEKGEDITPKISPYSSYAAYNAIHEGVGQVEVPRIELLRDATRIGTLTLDTDVIIARKRVQVSLPAVVMEDFKDIGQGISVRITNLQMSSSRQLTVTLSYKRTTAGTGSPFIEQVFALDPGGTTLGGGRWTEGEPFGKTGTYTAKFPLSGDQVHSAFRFEIVTESETRDVTFEVKDIFKR